MMDGLRCVVDTNVPATANGANAAATPDCMAASGRALVRVMRGGHLFLDDQGLIVAEYRANLHASGQPGPGDAFLKWVLTNEWAPSRVTRVAITPSTAAAGFDELSVPPGDVVIDPSDRKFFAVAAAHPERPPILQSLDSKWWGWRAALEQMGLSVVFLCEAEIAASHAEKSGA